MRVAFLTSKRLDRRGTHARARTNTHTHRKNSLSSLSLSTLHTGERERESWQAAVAGAPHQSNYAAATVESVSGAKFPTIHPSPFITGDFKGGITLFPAGVSSLGALRIVYAPTADRRAQPGSKFITVALDAIRRKPTSHM